MLKIRGIFTKYTNSREPSFYPTHVSCCRRHSVTFCDLFTYLLLSTHTFIILCPTCKELLHPATHRLSPFLNFLFVDLRSSTVCSDENTLVLWMDETFLSQFILPLLRVSSVCCLAASHCSLAPFRPWSSWAGAKTGSGSQSRTGGREQATN